MHCTEWIKDTAVKMYHCSLICVGECEILLSSSVGDVGLVIDSGITMHDHISAAIRACYFHLHSMATNKANSIAVPLMPSLLGYCNSCLYVGYHSSTRTTPPSACPKHCSKNYVLHKKDSLHQACLERTSLAACERVC